VTRNGLRLWVCALCAWTLCFVVLQRLGTWTPFAFVGVMLVGVAVSRNVVPRALLRPSLALTTVGLAGGALMVFGTHLAYRGLVAFAPPVAGATRHLLSLLNVAGFSPAVRALLIVLIASCEELIFRGLLPTSAPLGKSLPHLPSSRELTQIVAFAGVYAFTTLPLGSPLLVLCALACGSLWGFMRVATGSLVAPVLAHVVWDLGVLIVWPITAQLP
jgi:membrane protease YdiL (CAAX protease family)